MRRNVAGQVVTCNLNLKADGNPCTTGTTTVYVTGDGGTQAVGSVGSGACTHEGQGVWSYAPAQAETNYAQVSFVFVNSAAINAERCIYTTAYDASGQSTGVTVGTNNDKAGYSLSSAGVQAVWDFLLSGIAVASSIGKLLKDNIDAAISSRSTLGGTAQTGDAFARLGAPAGVSVSADIAAVKTDTASTLTNSNTILNRIGAFAGSGMNTILGFFRALARKDAALTPSDMGGTFDNTTDSMEARTDNGVKLDLTQAVPTSNTAGTTGDALNAARAQGFGKWVQTGTSLVLYAADGTTVVRTFTLDSATAPTSRT